MSVDPYQVLGVPYNAGEDEIKKKYRALVKQYHPDLHPDDPEAARKMSEINAAYEMIRSGEAEAYRGGTSYYSGGAAAADSTYGNSSSGGTQYYTYGNMDDFLNSFFGAFGFGTAASQMNVNEVYEKVRRNIAKGDYESAASLLDRMVMRDGRWYYFAAQINNAAGEYVEAVRCADEARRMDPTDIEFAELSAELHKRYDPALRRRRTLHTALSALTFFLVLMFVIRMILNLFGWLFFL